MQSLVKFPMFEPFIKNSGYDLYVFDKKDIEFLLKNWDFQASWKLIKTDMRRSITKTGFHKTAIARKKAPAPMRAYFENCKQQRRYEFILYHGCGRDEPGIELLTKYGAVFPYDPYHPIHHNLPNYAYDKIHSHYVFNVVLKEAGREIMTEILARLVWGGKAIISVRKDFK